MSDFDEEGADLNSGFRFSSQEDEAKDNDSDGLGLSSSGGESRHAGDSEDDDLFSSEESENSDDPPPDEDSDGATNDKPPKEDEPQEEQPIIDNNEEKMLNPEDELMTEEDREFLKDHDTQFKVQINPFKWMTNISKDFTQMTDTVNGNTEMTANQKLKKLTHKEKQMRYSQYIIKARKCLDSVKIYVDHKDWDNQKFYYHKCLDFYKKALHYATNNEEKARIHFQMGVGFVYLAGVQFESEFRAKYISRACKQFALCSQLTEDDHFDEEIDKESYHIQKFLIEKIIERTDDLEVLQQIFEVLQDQIPDEMKDLRDFVGEELFQIYYKLACEVDAATGEKQTALKYLNMCQDQAMRVKGREDHIITQKINELKKSISKREKNSRIKKAVDQEQKGDLFVIRGQYEKAVKKYKKAIELINDKSEDALAIVQLKLGKLYFDKLKDYLNARIHLVDFQLLTFSVKVRTDDISIGFQQARKMMQRINKWLNKHKVLPEKKEASVREKELQQIQSSIKDIGEQKLKAGKDVITFADYILNMYPPKCLQEVEEAALLLQGFENKKKIRRTLLRVISYYHPDKQPLDDEMNLKISEEITKHLNDFLSLSF